MQFSDTAKAVMKGSEMRKFTMLGLAAAAVLGLSLVSATPAMAANTCYTPSNVRPYLVSGNKIVWSTTGRCTGAFEIQSELMHYFGILPPAIPGVATVYGSGSNKTASKSQCDNGGSTTYYTRGLVWGGYNINGVTGYALSTQASTSNITFNHC